MKAELQLECAKLAHTKKLVLGDGVRHNFKSFSVYSCAEKENVSSVVIRHLLATGQEYLDAHGMQHGVSKHETRSSISDVDLNSCHDFKSAVFLKEVNISELFSLHLFHCYFIFNVDCD